MKFFKLIIVAALLLTSSGIMAADSLKKMTFAWIKSSNEIEVITDSPQNFPISILKITDNDNKAYGFDAKVTSDSLILKTWENINNEKNIIVKLPEQQLYAYFTVDYINQNLFYEGQLGVKLESNKTKASFRLWSPSATAVSVILTHPKDGRVVMTTNLTRKAVGLWETTLSGNINLEGLHYQYKVKAFGNEFIALDPYAKSMGAFNPKSNDKIGYGVIVLDSVRSSYQQLDHQRDDMNFVGMEVHVRDATISPNSPAPLNLKGTYLGFVSALDYYKSLGVSHLQLLPLQNYTTVNETSKNYQGPDTSRAEINYNWGYDPQNFFTPEGWFSTDATNPYSRITELQTMTKEIHKRKMGVVLDVVYNHLYNGEAFEASAPGMYLRRNRKGEISSGTGAGYSFESRSFMGRRLIVDSLKYWQDTFHFDGFRFDLMGFLDKETMREIRNTLHPETILYGEAWVFSDLPMHEATVKTDLPHELSISAFNDTSRDSYAGRNEGKGFIQGHFYDNNKVRSGIIGGIKNHPQWDLISQSDYDSFAESPLETLNYLTIHDGFTLWDKINLSVGGDIEKRLQLARNAYALLFTSQGRVVFQQGCEAGRSKPLQSNDPYPDRAHTSGNVVAENGVKYFHENSYSSSDATNRFDWDRAKNFSELTNYVKGLIEIRKNLPGLRMKESDSISRGVKFYPQYMNGVIAYVINNDLEKDLKTNLISARKILVVHNGEPSKQIAMIPEITNSSEWKVIADCKRAGLQSFDSSSVKVTNGQVSVNGLCSAILIKN